jgi:hypothetical protein
MASAPGYLPRSMRVAAPLIVLVIAGCSDGGRISLVAGPLDDAGDATTDASGVSGDDAANDAPQADTCGAEPWVEIDLVVGALSANGTSPLAGATFTTPLCPGKSRTSDTMGNIKGKLSKSVPFYGRLQSHAYTDMLTPEQQYDVDTTGVAVSMLPGIFTALIPGWGTDKSVVFLGAMKNGGTGACDAFDGIVFTVPGHPEAVLTYYSTDQIPAPVDGATSTTASGRASIAGLAPGPPVTVIATKTGCVVETKHGVNTGRAPLEAGFVSIMGAWIHNP